MPPPGPPPALTFCSGRSPLKPVPPAPLSTMPGLLDVSTRRYLSGSSIRISTSELICIVDMLRWSADCTLNVARLSSFLSPIALRVAARISATLPDSCAMKATGCAKALPAARASGTRAL